MTRASNTSPTPADPLRRLAEAVDTLGGGGVRAEVLTRHGATFVNIHHSDRTYVVDTVWLLNDGRLVWGSHFQHAAPATDPHGAARQVIATCRRAGQAE